MEQTPFKVIQTLREGGGVFAAVRLVECEQSQAVLKDFGCSPWLFRSSFGAWLAAREARAYRRLEGVPGVPRLIGRVSRHGLLLEYVAGVNCREAAPDRFSHDLFDRAGELLATVRARGVLHMDVGGNLIVGADGRPWLVDFGASLILGRALGPLRSRMANLRSKYDERALLKIKRRRAPHLLRPTEAQRSQARLPLEDWARLGERISKRAVDWLSRHSGAGAKARGRQD
jgi:hypothetical protein